MKSIFEELLPNPEEKDRKKSPESVMLDLQKDIESKYNSRISGIVTSSAEIIEGGDQVLAYTFYLVFSRHDDFSYPLFTATSVFKNGLYPIHLQSHYGPPKDYGQINDESEFMSAIQDILKDERTRNIITSMY